MKVLHFKKKTNKERKKNESKIIHARYVQYKYAFFPKVVYKLLMSICFLSHLFARCNTKIWETLISQKWPARGSVITLDATRRVQ